MPEPLLELSKLDWYHWLGIVAGIWLFALLLLQHHRLQNLKQRLKEDQGLMAAGRQLCSLSDRPLVLFDTLRKKVAYASPAFKSHLDSVGIRDSKSLLSDLRFFVQGESEPLTLEALLAQHHVKHRGTERETIRKNLSLLPEGPFFTTLRLRTFTDPSTHRPFDLISWSDDPCKKEVEAVKRLNPYSMLPNRFAAFTEVARRTQHVLDARNHPFALILVELDEAKLLRNLDGYKALDNLTTAVSQVLDEIGSRRGVHSYHLNDLTFLMLADSLEKEEDIRAFIDEFRTTVNQQYSRLYGPRNLTFSAGVSRFPESGTLRELFDTAYLALGEAQSLGTGLTQIGPKSRSDSQKEQEIVLGGEITRGLQRHEFQLHFQPIFRPDESLAGSEVLIRWMHPERGLIMPMQFIPQAEKSGQIIALGEYLLEESFRQLQSWKHFGFPSTALSVNISLRHLEDHTFIPYLRRLMDTYRFAPNRLKIEITEHAAMLNPTLAQRRLRELSELGIEIVLDDFGTGYSSFSHLATFPIRTLKIDGSFVQNILSDQDNRQIVQTITNLGHSLGMEVVAEGVEKREVASLLKEMGVDFLQGFYYAPPLPLLEYQYLLSRQSLE